MGLDTGAETSAEKLITLLVYCGTRCYLLFQVCGHVVENKLQVELAIGEDSSVSDVHKMCTVDNSACVRPRDACTDVHLLEHGFYCDEPASKLLLVPHTGELLDLVWEHTPLAMCDMHQLNTWRAGFCCHIPITCLWQSLRCDVGLGGWGRVAKLSLCIVHCNVYCCIMMLHNSTSSFNSSRLI